MGEKLEMTTCEGCARYEECEGYDHAWIICQGKDFKPRPEVSPSTEGYDGWMEKEVEKR